jgi:hypothetical protein
MPTETLRRDLRIGLRVLISSVSMMNMQFARATCAIVVGVIATVSLVATLGPAQGRSDDRAARGLVDAHVSGLSKSFNRSDRRSGEVFSGSQ